MREKAGRKSLFERLLQTPGSNGGVSGHRRKQMYLGYILETELADFASALNPEGSRVRQWKKPRMPSWVSDLSN